eukprot:TRINITY_DN25014_c0_g1_i1.p1 TRINITY_DN25014_c0_g1~~TRINITY_DN25014_c0_g1_i1.p1  ORF type:complete len:366 (+),score=130.29 TRINITY_DN25014_c0_g1_i1:57-1154(+)
MAPCADVVVLQYADLVAGKDLAEEIGRAFGRDGIGLLGVAGVPGFAERRAAAVGEIYKCAHLDAGVLKGLERPPFFQRGWDCGNEKMKDGTPDTFKGSFYFNPLVDSFPEKEKYDEHPTFYADNVFPGAHLPEYEAKVKGVAALLRDVGLLVARQCDRYAEAAHGSFAQTGTRIEAVLKDSRFAVARALHYFAREDAGAAASGPADSWCGWHNDHCALTGLMPAAYHDDAKAGAVVASPDPDAGLYVKTRSGEVLQVTGAPDTCFFQLGESAQIYSGGALMATPHMVRSAAAGGVSRSTLAVFMESGPEDALNAPEGTDGQKVGQVEHLPPGVPALSRRWLGAAGKDDNFGDFSKRTFAEYYAAA